MLRSLFTVYLIISQNVLIAQVAQVAQVAASSVASRGETACVHLREAPEEDSSAHLPSPPSVHTNTNTNTAHADTAK